MQKNRLSINNRPIPAVISSCIEDSSAVMKRPTRLLAKIYCKKFIAGVIVI